MVIELPENMRKQKLNFYFDKLFTCIALYSQNISQKTAQFLRLTSWKKERATYDNVKNVAQIGLPSLYSI